ncbi:transglycosylase SLT domain-containing protein [Lacimicrobium alkaliphilum]|uniref:Transglycosylase SLT domain-containing protein n=1 Tax=Lacimicrobium alkaliphilum TaxID=1526571 RepID=A0ABQ1R730_9ALTE|nr:transglycosylase SLT domain-containing protein [Lacimicrobium alkaliphilum]GGD60753.1 hypothetical protein GCM10011357_15080 [Lacimicrobium alkaliphilum]
MKLRTRNHLRKLSQALFDGAATKGLGKEQREMAEQLSLSAADWLTDSSLQGVGVGTKFTANVDTAEPCIKVYVDKKRPLETLQNPAPRKIQLGSDEPVPVDVIEIGEIKLQSARYAYKQRPLHAGLSVASTSRFPGTLGLVVRSKHDPVQHFILSNYHVLKPLSRKFNDDIWQQARQDGGDVDDSVAHFERDVPIHFSDNGIPNEVDAAVARLKPDIHFLTSIPGIGPLRGITGIIREGRFVQMVGRTSGLSRGRIIDADFQTRLSYQGPRGERLTAGFRNLVLCQPYTRPGDSGAVVVNASKFAVGLHMAGSDQVSVFCRIKPVFDHLNIKLLHDLSETLQSDNTDEQSASEQINAGINVQLDVLRRSHGIFDSVSWRLTPQGLEVNGAVTGSPGELITVPGVIAQFDPLIRQASIEFGVPYELILACICTESGGKPDVSREEPGFRSDSQTPHRVSVELMQTLISTAREALDSHAVSRTHLIRPDVSIRAGAAYIRQQYSMTQFDPPKVACAYNAGGIYQNRGSKNRWKMRQYPVGMGTHADRFVMWFNDCFRYFASQPGMNPPLSFYTMMNGN